jgi:hypothetical protein
MVLLDDFDGLFRRVRACNPRPSRPLQAAISALNGRDFKGRERPSISCPRALYDSWSAWTILLTKRYTSPVEIELTSQNRHRLPAVVP